MAERPKRYTVLAMPGYGRQTQAAGRALWRASSDMDSVDVQAGGGSLLAHNFNSMWCHALNLAHQGKPVDYFAMIHDDIGVADGWLDRLIDELEARELDVLGVVVPIKDNRGLTSIALQRNGTNWEPAARLSMREVFQLPATFTSEDIGLPILLNTGCWVCRFDMRWATKVWFNINDRIAFDIPKNRYRAINESEDWFFSRLLHELGLKIGATRKIIVMHRGETDYTNAEPWGRMAFDSDSTPVSLIPNAFPHEIDGWLLPEEGAALAELARGKRVLEIGSYLGKSTVCLARTAAHVTSVDTHDGRGTPAPRETFEGFVSNLIRYGVWEKVHAIVGDWDSVQFSGEAAYDLVFIDGSHDYDSVQSDIEHAIKLLAPGGVLVFHDYRQNAGDFDGRWDQGVTDAVDDLLAAGGELLETHETLAVVRPPALVPQEV